HDADDNQCDANPKELARHPEETLDHRSRDDAADEQRPQDAIRPAVLPRRASRENADDDLERNPYCRDERQDSLMGHDSVYGWTRKGFASSSLSPATSSISIMPRSGHSRRARPRRWSATSAISATTAHCTGRSGTPRMRGCARWGRS